MAGRMKFNFRSSGQRATDKKFKTTKQSAKSILRPIGIKTPIETNKDDINQALKFLNINGSII